MNYKLFYTTICKIFFVLMLVNVSALGQNVQRDYQDGIVMVKIKDDITLDKIKENKLFVNPGNDVLYKKYKIKSVKQAFADCKSDRIQRLLKIDFDQKDSVEVLISELKKLPFIEYIDKEPIVKLYSVPTD